MIHKNIFVFDIETVPDTEAVECLTGFESDNVDLVKEMLESQNVCVDNKEYYVGDYYLKDKNFDMKFISYNLYK